MIMTDNELTATAQNINDACNTSVSHNLDNTDQLATILADIQSRYDTVFKPLTVVNTTLEVLQLRDTKEHIAKLMENSGPRNFTQKNNTKQNPMAQLPLWAKVWPASFVLDRFLRKVDAAGQSLLELGAGCGTLGLSASQYGFSHVTVSDIHPDALLFAKANILQNNLQDKVTANHLDFTKARLEQRFDYIAGSEILAQEDTHRPLCKFLVRHLARHENATILFCNDTRRKVGHFFKLAARDFVIAEQTVSLKATNPDGTEERQNYTIHRLRHKYL